MQINFTETKIEGAVLAQDFIRQHVRLCLIDAQDYGVSPTIRHIRIEQMFENCKEWRDCDSIALPGSLIPKEDHGFKEVLQRMGERRGYKVEFVNENK